VDSFGDDPIAKQMQAMVITALSESKRFIVTENKEKADAVLKGVTIEKTWQELHASGESTVVAAAAGAHKGSVSGSVVNGTGSVSGSSSGRFVARSLGTSDDVATTETVDNARLAVRLVASDGDVLWAATKESHGAKYKGASADVADMIVKQLCRDLDKLKPTDPPKGEN
jgi:curli biogenesis system outer membrane secretion channel CsgG